MPAQVGEKVYQGIPASTGLCRGKVLVLGKVDRTVPQYSVPEDQLAQEVQRFESGLIETRRQILEVQRQLSEGVGAEDAGIFDAHLLVLEDRTLLDEVHRMVYGDKVNVEHAVHSVAERYATAMSNIGDEYLRERATDIRDVAARILGNLLQQDHHVDLGKITEPCIIVADDLPPSITAQLNRKLVLGFATDVGSRTSHTAIMARALQIPAVVGLEKVSHELVSGQSILLDGYTGLLIVNPTDQTLFEYGQLVRWQTSLQEKLKEIHDEPAITLDGVRITLSANIEQAADVVAVKESGAEGVGLFRTEYLFLNRKEPPTEEEQAQAYREVAAALKPHPVVIRTMDLGGDKIFNQSHIPHEMNPFLGWRAIRFCLQEREFFRAQLRAILRASVEENLKVMYPMISGVEELLQANELVEQYKAELRRENIPFDEKLDIGIMVEIPSAALTAPTLARHSKFFSLGTNDLIQYTLAVDRLNEKIAHLYEPTHPAIIRLIKMSVDAAHARGIWAGVCGEMAGEVTLVPLLLGLGVDELSAAPGMIPQVKYLIRRLKISETRELAEFALQCESARAILERSEALVRRVAPCLFERQP